MSKKNSKTEVTKRNTKPTARSNDVVKYETTDFMAWLATLEVEVKPTLHINGPSHPTALVTLDFGTPLKPIKLENEEMHEIMTRMKKLAKEINSGRDVRVSHDQNNGVFYASAGA